MDLGPDLKAMAARLRMIALMPEPECRAYDMSYDFQNSFYISNNAQDSRPEAE